MYGENFRAALTAVTAKLISAFVSKSKFSRLQVSDLFETCWFSHAQTQSELIRQNAKLFCIMHKQGLIRRFQEK